MAGLIPDSFIEELLGRVDIVEIIERRVPLKRAGREFQPPKTVLPLLWLRRPWLRDWIPDELRRP
jgi:hypothetical protein